MFGSGFFSGNGVFGNLFGPRFSCELKCQPLAFMGRDDLENGNRFILPSAVLEKLQSLDVPSPYLFEIGDLDGRQCTHGGVQEFIAPEDVCYIPYWMLKQLQVEENDFLQISLKTLPKATHAVFKPASVSLHRVFDQRALLESGLKGYVTLTVGDSFNVEYEGQQYGIEVVDLKPEYACHLVDTNLEVDFVTPKDQEAAASKAASRASSDDEGEGSPKPVRVFGGGGRTIAGASVAAIKEEDDEFDEMPWKKRIPRGVKHTTAPYGFDPQRIIGQHYGRSREPSVERARDQDPATDDEASPTSSFRGRSATPSGKVDLGEHARSASPEEARMRVREAAEVRYAMNAEEIEKRRKEEEEQQAREQERVEQEAKEAAKREEEKRQRLAAPAQQHMSGGGSSTGRPPPDKRRSSAGCCSCFSSRGQPAKPGKRI